MLYFLKHFNKKNKNWVTFIHGAGGSSSIWYKQVKEFSKSFNVLLIDLRGHGKSKNHVYNRLKSYTFEKISDDIIEVLDYLKIKKTHFVGISLGTILIREISERYPNRSLSMIMGGAIMKLNIRSQILMNIGFLLRSIIPYLLVYKFFALIIMPKKTHKRSRLLFINEAKKLYQKEYKRWFSLISEINPLLRLFRIRDTGIPTLYIMGSEDYMFLPSIKKLVKNHSSALLKIIPKCGHVVNVEKPNMFNKVSINFLTNLEKKIT